MDGPGQFEVVVNNAKDVGVGGTEWSWWKACWPELTDPAAAFAAAWTLVLSTASSYCL